MLNLQITPYTYEDAPVGAEIVQLVAREGQGDRDVCNACKATGLVRGEVCQKCSGKGEARFTRALRMNVAVNRYAEIADWLDALTLPPNCKVQRTVRLYESGGGLSNTGRSTIVCGMKGEKFTSFGGHAACGGNHAIFFVHTALVIQYSRHHNEGNGTVRFVGVDRKQRHHLGIQEELLWTFKTANDIIEAPAASEWLLQTNMSSPLEAIEAAIQKSWDYHCRCAYYALGKFARGMSGVRG